MMPSPPPLVMLNGIRKVFDRKTVIPDISLTLEQGEFVTLLGPSGCGKTTLLRLIAGLESPGQANLSHGHCCTRKVNHYRLFLPP